VYATLHAPDFHLQAATMAAGDADPYEPAALLDRSLVDLEKLGEKGAGKTPILEANESAQVMGVRIGMTAAQAQARYAALQLCYRSVENESALRACFLEIADSFTPDYEDTAAGICTLDLAGSRFGKSGRSGCENFAEEMMRACDVRKLEIRIGIARHPDLSLLAARLAGPDAPRLLWEDGDENSLRAELGELPVTALEPGRDTLQVLNLWGIRKISELTALSRDAVVARLGTEIVPLWTLATGGAPRLLQLVKSPEAFEERVNFDHEITALEPLLFYIRRIIETLAVRLSSSWLVARRIVLHFLSDREEVVYRVALIIPDPCCDVEFLFQRTHRYLENFVAAQPIAGLTMRIDPVRGGGHQFHLFDSSLRDPNRFAETLSQIESVLSDDRVGIPSYVSIPGIDNAQVLPFDEKQVAAILEGKQKETPIVSLALETAIRLGPRLRRFRSPRHLYVEIAPDGAPVAISGGGSLSQRCPIHQKRGPWLHTGDWWHPASLWRSQEWDIVIDDNQIHCLSCRFPGWYSQGVYG
jgi:protein ImuB